MADFGKFDFKDLLDLKNKLSRLSDPGDVVDDIAKSIAVEIIKMVKSDTPVDTGELRRNWVIGEIKRLGNMVYVEIINPLEYAPYVEYGHRTRNHKGWVNGKFMLTKSIETGREIAPEIIRRKLEKYLKEFMP